MSKTFSDLAEDALHDADGYRIRYDSFRGYPRLLDIDWVRNAVDDELEIRAEGFFPLQ